MLQKRPCYLDHNWRSYVEIFISAKIDDEMMMCVEARLSPSWGSDEVQHMSSLMSLQQVILAILKENIVTLSDLL